MKFLASSLIGMIIGAALFVVGMYYNPFAEQLTVSPLAISDDEQLDFTARSLPKN